MLRTMLRTKRTNRDVASPAREVQIDRGVALGFMLVALNPAFLVAWTAFVSLLESGSLFALTMTARDAPVLAFGAFVGIVGWFLTLLTMVSRNRARFSPENLRRVSLGVALLLIAIGAWTLVEVVRVKIVSA